MEANLFAYSNDLAMEWLEFQRAKWSQAKYLYVVTKMNEWMKEGKDFKAMMPYLSRYLGHTSIDETQYYYHQVVSAFEIVRKHDSIADRVIPEVVPYEE